MKLEYTVIDNKYKTLKCILIKEFGISRKLITKLKNNNRLFVNKHEEFVSYNLKINDQILIDMDFIEDSENVTPIDLKLDIIYEDDYYIIINKPSNMTVHPTMNHYDNTLANGLKYYYIKKRNK